MTNFASAEAPVLRHLVNASFLGKIMKGSFFPQLFPSFFVCFDFAPFVLSVPLILLPICQSWVPSSMFILPRKPEDCF